MEQHPIPQNVTTFQFRLIGDMTIKQFGYLAGGIIAAYVCYKLPLPFFFTWPMAVASGLLGFGLAFVPIEERPMDVWVASFIKSVYSPTQWVWSREAPRPPAPPINANPVPTASVPVARAPGQTAPFFGLIRGITALIKPHVLWPTHAQSGAAPAPRKAAPPGVPAPHPTQPAFPEIPASSGVILTQQPVSHLFLQLRNLFQGFNARPAASLSPGFSFSDAFAPKQAPAARAPSAGAPHPVQPGALGPQPAISAGSQPGPVAAPRAPEQHDRVALLQNQLSDVMRERERLEKELIAMRQRASQLQPGAAAVPQRQASVVLPASPAAAPTVRVISPGAAAGAGLPRLTTFPNVVTGIIKDQYGNLLSGMLVTVRDKNDVPLRALKTNRLGQFAASTPLPNNTYIVEIEDPKSSFFFDKAQIQLGGAVAPPLEITAKSQKQIDRDKLAREIFGNQTV